MQLKNSSERYGAIARIFHWVMALAIFGMLAVGFIMTDLPMNPDKFRVYGIHKSVGALILIAALLRLLWRLINLVPPLPAHMPLWERLGAHGSHIALYILLFIMPLSGWLMSSAAGFPVSVFGWFTLPNLIAPDKALQELLVEVHELLAFAIIGLVTLHAAAALKHHFIDKDNVLRRMLPMFALLLLPLSAMAQGAPPTWFINPEKSSLKFTAIQNDAPVEGTFKTFRTGIAFAPDRLEQSKIRAEIDLASVSAAYAPIVQAIATEPWFDVAHFPKAVFTSLKISHLADKNYVVEGLLELRGRSLPVIVHFTLEEYNAQTAVVKGEATLSRLAFGVGQGEWQATDIIKDDVGVSFVVTATPTPYTPPVTQ